MNTKYQVETIKVPRFEESEGFYTTKKRSQHMAKIKGKNTKPELTFRKALYRHGVRFRVNVKHLPGKPDIANVKRKFVVFIDGEFWHGFNWIEKRKRIKANRGFWIPKIERNIQRDQQNNIKLKDMGFWVFRFWEQDVKKDVDACVNKVLDALSSV